MKKFNKFIVSYTILIKPFPDSGKTHNLDFMTGSITDDTAKKRAPASIL